MAIAPMPQVLVMKDVTMQIGTDDYKRHLSSVVFTPSSSSITWQGLSPDASFSDAGSETWTCALTGAQDWDSAAGLCRYLFAHAGETVAAVFKPRAGSGPSFEADITLVSPGIGGAVNAVAEFSVTCGVVGRPELVDTP